MASFEYPPTHRSDQVDNYHGTTVADPYRWLEDVDSKETHDWVKAQNQLTFSYLEQIPARPKIRDRLTKLWNYERFGLPAKRGAYYFFTRNDGLQNQSVLHVAETLDGPARVLLDPNTLSDEGTVALANWVPSPDGKLLAYGLAADGSDWREWRVLHVHDGQMTMDHLEWIKFSSVSWTADSQGFFYSRYDAPPEGKQFTGTNYFQKLYYHRLGDRQEQDQLIYERPDHKEWGFGGYVTDDGRYLIISVWKGTLRKNQLLYKDLTKPDSPIVELLTGFDAEYDFVGNDAEHFWIATDRDAARRKVVRISLENPGPEHWQSILEESKHVLENIQLVGQRLLATYLKDAHSLVQVFSLEGELVHQLKLPGIGSARGFGGRSTDQETFYTFTNYTTPSTTYRLDISNGTSAIYRQPKVLFDPQDYETRQVFYRSKDGTRIPMFISYRKGMGDPSQRPTILYGYGGFDISLTPGFSVANLVWMERGGIYVVANLRGGGEYGRAWHEAGMLAKKQNVFDDFVAAADFLVSEGYTRRDQLAIRGGSNGGLLVGAVMTQRPDLCAAALPAVGVMDMLRYHKFTIGWAWVSEYGSSDDPDQFANLLRYSPLHRLKPGTQYPATLVTTADHDDRVVPGHSFKFAAALQHAHRGSNPVFIRVESKAGHGAGTPTSKRIEIQADIMAFLEKVLQVKNSD
ncbi:MAG: prolyl oligopeptidase family serine peptidase [Planctomycetota bacterium]|nr:prolyl oligopeptidase family serine peptidase [Planctomycetota bacterium]